MFGVNSVRVTRAAVASSDSGDSKTKRLGQKAASAGSGVWQDAQVRLVVPIRSSPVPSPKWWDQTATARRPDPLSPGQGVQAACGTDSNPEASQTV